MPPKNSGGSTKFPGGHKVIHKTAQTAVGRVVTPRPVATFYGSQIYFDDVCRFARTFFGLFAILSFY